MNDNLEEVKPGLYVDKKDIFERIKEMKEKQKIYVINQIDTYSMYDNRLKGYFTTLQKAEDYLNKHSLQPIYKRQGEEYYRITVEYGGAIYAFRVEIKEEWLI